MRVLAATAVMLAALGAAVYLLLRDSDDEPGWTSATGTVLAAGSCRAPAPDLGFSSLPPPPAPAPDRVSARLVGVGEYYWVRLEDLVRRAPGGWKAHGRMLAPDANGSAVEEVSHDRFPGNSKGGRESRVLGMRIGQEPGFYRLDIRLDRGAASPFRYSIYLKALERHAEGRLAIDATRFRAGERVVARVENLGTESIQFGVGAGLEREDDGGWETVPRGPIAVPAIQLIVEPGQVGGCDSFALDDSLPHGRYRLRKGVTTYAEPRGYNGHSLVSTEFEIVD